LRNIEILEKARKVRALGLNCLDGIISTHGKDKAEQIIDLLLEASLLGFNLADLNDIFSEWQNTPKTEITIDPSINTLSVGVCPIDDSTKSHTISIESDNSVKVYLNKTSIFSLIKTKFNLNFDVEKSYDLYSNPYRKDDFLDIEDMLLSLGFPPVLALGVLGGSHLTKEFKNKSFEYVEERSNNSFNMSTRTHFKKTAELKEVLLNYLEKYLNSNHVKIDITPQHESLIDWLNRKYPIVDVDETTISWTPLSERKIYSFINKEIQSVWVGSMFYQDSKTDSLPCAFDQEVVSNNGDLNTTNGVCELIYRDAITKSIIEMSSKDIDFLKYEGTIKKICENRNTPYTTQLSDDIYRFILNLKVGGSKPKIVLSGLKPIHYLLVLVCANYYLSNKV